MKTNTIYPVKDKELLKLGFKFMYSYVNESGTNNTTYFRDKVMATKMLAQIVKK